MRKFLHKIKLFFYNCSDKIYRFIAYLWYPFLLLVCYLVSFHNDNKYLDLLFYACIALNIYYFVYLVRMIITSIKDNIRLHNQRLIVLIGSMGCGKTSRGMYLAVKQAMKNWRYIQSEYKYLRRRLKVYERRKDVKKLEHWKEVKEAYEYWINSNSVPCLLSNIPIMVDGKYCSQLSIDHFYQTKKLLYRSVLFVDEASLWFANYDYKDQIYKDKRLMLATTVRFVRHIIDGHIIMTEQDSGSLDIEVRRRTAINLVMYEQTWILQSYILRTLYFFARRFLPYPIERFIYNIYIRVGFRQYKWDEEQNTERTQAIQIRGQDFEYNKSVVPALLNFCYDDRTFKHLYFARSAPLYDKIFDDVILSFDDLVALGYVDRFKSLLPDQKK